MLPRLDDSIENVLRHFYNKLDSVITTEKIRLYKKSIFLTLIKIPTNKTTKLLSDAAISNKYFRESVLQSLLQDGFIREISDIEMRHKYCITALGIWAIETQTSKVDLISLINFFQETKYTSGESNKPLADVEKIILLSLIAIRNFSVNSAMDLNENKKRDYWIEIFSNVADYLYGKGCIKKSKWQPSNAGNEPPVNFVMRRSRDLPQKTKHIFVFVGNSKYYLDIENEERRNIILKFLFSIIFGKIESKTALNEIHSFLCKMAYDQGKNVRENFDFINDAWDSILKEALDDLFYDQ